MPVEKRGARFRARYVADLGTFDTQAAAEQALEAQRQVLISAGDPTVAARVSLSGELQSAQATTQPTPSSLAGLEELAAPTLPALEAPLALSGNALILGDLHSPYFNVELLRRAVALCRLWYPSIDTVLIIGDLFNAGKVSTHPQDGPEIDPQDELAITGNLLRWLGRFFARVVVVNGNHDERYNKRLNARFGMQALIDASLGAQRPACEYLGSNLDYALLGERWVAGHPSSFSGLGGKTPSEYADVYARNVITGHNHRFGMAPSASGRYIGIDAGHMTRPEAHWYVKRRLNKFARWAAGFVILSNDHAELFTEGFTDWRRYGL